MTATFETIDQEVGSYLAEVMVGLAESSPCSVVWSDDDELANAMFDVLTGREFCYLGRTKVAAYREQVVESMRRRIPTGEAFRFFYDIGPGYHASTRPGVTPLNFDVGLSELLILFQISALCGRISESYAPGARFWLVIDNLCGLRTNDIPVELTVGYSRRLRALIAETGLSDVVELIVESEAFDLVEYDSLLAARDSLGSDEPPSAAAIDNVARFLGRPCTAEEAAERIERYRRSGPVTDFLVDRLVQDVHMTQRATGATLGFRPFPGGDSRTQCGEVALTRGSRGRLRPVLLTTRNIDEYDCLRLELPDVLPSLVGHVTFASRAER